jgi:hypothetical protein
MTPRLAPSIAALALLLGSVDGVFATAASRGTRGAGPGRAHG